jgi:hypothetical protein
MFLCKVTIYVLQCRLSWISEEKITYFKASIIESYVKLFPTTVAIFDYWSAQKHTHFVKDYTKITYTTLNLELQSSLSIIGLWGQAK